MTIRRFGPAAPAEPTVFGAGAPPPSGSKPGTDPVGDWLDAIQERGIRRVCCLLTEDQLADYDDLLDRYRARFGSERVLHEPVPDFELADPESVGEEILPFLFGAVRADEPVVVHCSAGIGRTGQVIAAWLAVGRGFEAEEAIQTVIDGGRNPREAIEAGNANPGDLTALLRQVRERFPDASLDTLDYGPEGT